MAEGAFLTDARAVRPRETVMGTLHEVGILPNCDEIQILLRAIEVVKSK